MAPTDPRRQELARSQRADRRCPISGSSLFFLIPFVIVFKISLSQTAIAQPPYTPVLDSTAEA